MRVNWTKRQAIKHFGSVTAMANALGTTTQAISILKDKLSAKKQLEIVGYIVKEGIKNGTIKVQEVEE